MWSKMHLFKKSFSGSRKNPKIFKGFDLYFRSDVTEYFVHEGNEGYFGRTYMSQAIGEAVIFFCENILFYMNWENAPLRYETEEGDYAELKIEIPDEWTDNEVIWEKIGYYKVRYDDIMKKINIAVFDREGKFFLPDEDSPVYEFLPAFMAVLAMDYDKNEEIEELVDVFVRRKTVKDFVRLCETFYQIHKNEEYEIIDDCEF